MNLVEDMKTAVSDKDPERFLEKIVDFCEVLFNKIERLESEVKQMRNLSALAIQWEPRIAADMLAKQIEILRKNKDVYHKELGSFKQAYIDGIVTANYADFCQFWTDTLGWHPFLDYSGDK